MTGLGIILSVIGVVLLLVGALAHPAFPAFNVGIALVVIGVVLWLLGYLAVFTTTDTDVHQVSQPPEKVTEKGTP
jgi:drug/metabolite transporter (DMT)-like permease